MNIQSGWKGSEEKTDQPVKGTECGLSRIMDEEIPSSVPGQTYISFITLELRLIHQQIFS